MAVGVLPQRPDRSGGIDRDTCPDAGRGRLGWASAQILLVELAGVLLLGVFVAIQAARREPLMRLAIFGAPNLAAANIAQLLLGVAWVAMWFFLNLYLQQVLGLSAFPSGSALLPMTTFIMLGMIVVAPR